MSERKQRIKESWNDYKVSCFSGNKNMVVVDVPIRYILKFEDGNVVITGKITPTGGSERIASKEEYKDVATRLGLGSPLEEWSTTHYQTRMTYPHEGIRSDISGLRGIAVQNKLSNYIL